MKIRFVGISLVALGAGIAPATSASAEDLVMPFTCSLDGPSVRLAPSPPQRYAVLGKRDEQAFAACRPSSSDCTTVMVHRFAVLCGSEKVAWARIAAAARDAGVAMPDGLPQGFAPVGALQGRFLFPALARFSKHEGGVSSELLSADGVVDRGGDSTPGPAPWQTVIRAEMAADAPAGALRIAGVIALLMTMLLALSTIAAGRTPETVMAFRNLRTHVRRLRGSALSGLDHLANRVSAVIASFAEPAASGNENLLNALAIANARLAETELLIAVLPRDFLLREVLQTEIDSVRARLEAITAVSPAKARDAAAARVRGILRDIERIARIAHGAAGDGSAQGASANSSRQGFRMPESAREAYQMLGVNPDAAPAVAKKLVDALRMSWHPDFARDEDDRQLREARMKQINAAWDLIKDRRQAA